MGKSLPSTSRLQELSRIFASDKLQHPKRVKPTSRNWVPPSPEPAKLRGFRLDWERSREGKTEESSEDGGVRQRSRLPLAEVVADCVKRWFQDALKEAKGGDAAMQILVGQMYYSGYGVSKDAQKGRAWMSRASKSRSSSWKVGNKRPGYNASDSDSDDAKKDDK